MNKYLTKLSNYITHVRQDEEMSAVSNNLDFEKIDNKMVEKNKKVLFVIPQMLPGMGGLTSILRVALRLSQNRYKVYYASYNCDDIESMSAAARINLANYEGEFIKLSDARNMIFEFVIGSNWQSVFFLKNIPGYKLYFVQDYEPYFYPYGDNYFLAKASYSLGLHIISLGKWNIDQIKKNGEDDKIKCNWVEFPFEKDEYPFNKKDFESYKNKKAFNIAVFVKREAKRMPSLLLQIIEKSQAYMKSRYQIDLNYKVFGLNIKEKIPAGTNLGKLTKKEIFELYKTCDFGMVSSLTNISLVPYEMLSSGLPVIEFNCGTYADFLGKETATLVSFDYKDLCEKLHKAITNPEKLQTQLDKASSIMNGLSWDKTGKQFVDILNKIEDDSND